MCIKRILCAVVCVLVSIGGAFAIDLQGTVSVSVTSDTATTAKDQAFNQARRQILTEALRQYTDAKSLQGVIADVKNSDLMNLVSASSIDSEQLSHIRLAQICHFVKGGFLLDRIGVRCGSIEKLHDRGSGHAAFSGSAIEVFLT